MSEGEAAPTAQPAALQTVDLGLQIGRRRVLQGIDIAFPSNSVTALIGPSGCGKTSFLRCLNRLTELWPGAQVTGQVLLQGMDVDSSRLPLPELRRRIGMVFQRPNPFPGSVFDNVAYGVRLHRRCQRQALEEIVEAALHSVGLWEEVRDRLDEEALALSLGQQQRLVLARALAVEPEVLLLDEPASSLDPISTLRIETLIAELKSRYTIVLVTHNVQQAARVADYTAFLYDGRLLEWDESVQLFTNPRLQETEDYITGRYG
ncbi:MAG: phosphate ABC transporter ATP-binding protein [Xanthomonadales bacterium]|nr:phosphate ABC transporter ATP-binding protein [Xanthomonadales bacterium]